ncbi:MAG: glycosyltransferase, partial [Gemmatimonadales bacterium]
MRLCFIADGRSPIAHNWIRHFLSRRSGFEVHLISSHVCDGVDLPGATIHTVETIMSSTWLDRRQQPESAPASAGLGGLAARGLRAALSEARWWVGPLDLPRAAREVRALLDHIRPDLVHAMRIPVEGMLAARALADSRIPLVVSVWGNDFTRFAQRYPLLARETRRTMLRADGLHPDCRRDLELAYTWGFAPNKPSLVAPSGGGVQRERFRPGAPDPGTLTALAVAERDLTVFNPRGIRPYVRNDTFLRA